VIEFGDRRVVVFPKLALVRVNQFSVLSKTYLKSSALQQMKKLKAQNGGWRIVRLCFIFRFDKWTRQKNYEV